MRTFIADTTLWWTSRVRIIVISANLWLREMRLVDVEQKRGGGQHGGGGSGTALSTEEVRSDVSAVHLNID